MTILIDDNLDTTVACPTDAIYRPFNSAGSDTLIVVGQIGQSLDGRIATSTGESKYINCPEGMTHLHKLRALCDAVIVGVGTAICDDPMLNVRHVSGANPARVVIDPKGRLPAAAKLLKDDGTRRLIVTANADRNRFSRDIEMIVVEPRQPKTTDLHPADVILALRQRGMKRFLIEGGADTVSRFLISKCLTRLHVSVAPMILGAGKTGFSFTGVDRLVDAVRPNVRTFPLGQDTLFDCDLESSFAIAPSDIPLSN